MVDGWSKGESADLSVPWIPRTGQGGTGQGGRAGPQARQEDSLAIIIIIIPRNQSRRLPTATVVHPLSSCFPPALVTLSRRRLGRIARCLSLSPAALWGSNGRRPLPPAVIRTPLRQIRTDSIRPNAPAAYPGPVSSLVFSSTLASSPQTGGGRAFQLEEAAKGYPSREW
ncbi:hypothetical protein LX36DRAFT_124337 [Colletotrichum falcatum]|nr:hypothetical protein LX36DRAFT_124337 [Colletotrichum falcatum]